MKKKTISVDTFDSVLKMAYITKQEIRILSYTLNTNGPFVGTITQLSDLFVVMRLKDYSTSHAILEVSRIDAIMFNQ
jgi:hypothetical protein